jgi:GPH family glycoside/pentoside/hexuronide:cation symporter
MTEDGIDAPRAPERLTLKTHICYGVSQFGLNAAGTAFGIYTIVFYTTVIVFDSALFGVIMFIGQLWDAVSDPLIGYLSDNTKWRRGRRRPFFVPGGLLYGIAFFMVFSPFLQEKSGATFLYLLIFVLLMFSGRTILETPYVALAPELTLDYDERTKLSGFKQWFGTLGDASGAIVPVVLVTLVFEGQRRPAHFVYGLFACVAVVGLAALTRWGTFENPALARKAQIGVFESFKAVSRNRPYLIFIFSSTMAQMGNNIVTYLVIFITKFWFLDEELAIRFFLIFFLGALVSVPIWVRLAGWIGKKWTYVLVMTGYGLLLSSVMLFSREAVNAVTVIMFFAGFFNVGMWVLAYTIAPDIIEWDEYHTGKRREGVYSGVWTFVYKAGIGCALMLVGFALKFIHFDGELATQTESTLLGLRVLFGPVAGMFLFLGALAFLVFPITKSKHEEIRRLIRERDAAEAAE